MTHPTGPAPPARVSSLTLCHFSILVSCWSFLKLILDVGPTFQCFSLHVYQGEGFPKIPAVLIMPVCPSGLKKKHWIVGLFELESK